MERIEGYEPSDQSSNLCRDAKCTLSQVVWQLTFNQRINGSIPLECTKLGAISLHCVKIPRFTMSEGAIPSVSTKYFLSTTEMQLTLNQWIKGSNPLGSTMEDCVSG